MLHSNLFDAMIASVVYYAVGFAFSYGSSADNHFIGSQSVVDRSHVL